MAESTMDVVVILSTLVYLVMIVVLRNLIAQSTNYYLYITFGSIGIVLHESAHLLTAMLFRHKIVDFQPFKPNQMDHTLGYVIHSYRPSWFSPIANSVIGIAPLFAGIGGVYLVTAHLRPDVASYFLEGITLNGDISLVLINLTAICEVILISPYNGYLTALWLFLSYSILIHCVPSKADFSQSMIGLVMLVFGMAAIAWLYSEVLNVIQLWLLVINNVFGLVTLALIVILTITKIAEIFCKLFR
ncbi:hypothetical protein [Shewanella sp. SM96]|uniref:hypothetical protein n=1 Tax=Shewanella TaxID=22 RepID=UPI0021DA3774|nr:hypothetical protein [Shewanella sp. SM96]MCU8005697.1 hypothetical protein [Shewanella sp. SM96]